MTAFLIITDAAGNVIELEIDTDSAHRREPETVGATTRSFAGTFLSDVEEFRVWDFVAVNLFQPAFTALENMVKNDAAVSIAGDAMAGEVITGIVRITDAPFWDDARADEGFTRSASLTILEG